MVSDSLLFALRLVAPWWTDGVAARAGVFAVLGRSMWLPRFLGVLPWEERLGMPTVSPSRGVWVTRVAISCLAALTWTVSVGREPARAIRASEQGSRL